MAKAKAKVTKKKKVVARVEAPRIFDFKLKQAVTVNGMNFAARGYNIGEQVLTRQGYIPMDRNLANSLQSISKG